jgi:hypothetical protein
LAPNPETLWGSLYTSELRADELGIKIILFHEEKCALKTTTKSNFGPFLALKQGQMGQPKIQKLKNPKTSHQYVTI